MRAVVNEVYGGPEVLELREVPDPTPDPGQVLVRVVATSLQPLDWHLMRGEPLIARPAMGGVRRPTRTILGSDLAGTVVAVGPGVTDHQVGDEVFGFAGSGGALAELVAVDATDVVPRPEQLTPAQAGAVGVAATTALQGLRDQAQVQAGERVLVLGASGGVGTFAVQIAAHLGAHVTGVCSTRNLDLVRDCGADEVVDRTTTDVLDGSRRFDVILHVTGHRTLSDMRAVLDPGGRVVLIGANVEGRVLGVAGPLLGMQVLGKLRRHPIVRSFTAAENHDDLVVLRGLAVAGALRPVVDRTFPLVDAADAMAYMEEGRASGKVVVSVT